MAMRITNKIMQNNALYNINNVKTLVDDLETQMSTGKKISRPSDDPVIAIRALRLRTTLSEITQYSEKNVEDADSWLQLTEDAVDSLVDVLTDLYEQCSKGVDDYLDTSDRTTILENLKALRDEVYDLGDSDYAGRGLFTGYRTSTSLRFEEDTELTYSITEKVDKSALDSITYVNTGALTDINASNYTEDEYTVSSTDVYSQTVYRLRLSYDNIDAEQADDMSITYYSGANTEATIPITVISEYNEDGTDPYLYASQQSEACAVLIPETGEIILNEAAYEALSATKDYSYTDGVDESVISITYNKTSWEEGDVRPQHYFECIEDPDGEAIKHNVDSDVSDQIISYDVGSNQEIRVNTLASECFTTDIGRDIDDLISIIEDVEEIEDVIASLESIMADSSISDEDYAAAETSLTAANKALSLLNDKLGAAFESTMTKMQEHLDTANLALTSIGTRTSKLELVKSRLTTQQTSYEELVSSNEDADTVTVATELASAEVAYDAALAATSKLLSTSLLNYI